MANVSRSISLNVYSNSIPSAEIVRRTKSLVDQRVEDKKLLLYLKCEPWSTERAQGLLKELSPSIWSKEFWAPLITEETKIEEYFDNNEVLDEWQIKYKSLLRHQVKQKDTRCMGMRRRLKYLLRNLSRETTTVIDTDETALDITYLKAWIKGLGNNEYANENREMELVYGIDFQTFIGEMRSADENEDGVLSQEEFMGMMVNYHKRNNYQTSSAWERAWNAIAYADQISCSPPALGVLFLCLLNIAIYIGGCITRPGIFVPYCSRWIYNPNRRYEVQRYLTCPFIHAEPIHLINNMILLLLVGIPLEMYHSTWRVFLVYFIGSLSGSILVSVVDKKKALAGASGGVSSLAAAHVADIVLNWSETAIIFRQRLRTNRPAKVIKSESVRIGRLCIIGFMISLDVYNCLRQRYGSSKKGGISYISHIGGAIFGFLIGYLVLHNHYFRKNNAFIRILIFIICLSAWAFMILEHVFNPEEFPPIDNCEPETFKVQCALQCYQDLPSKLCNITFC